MMGNRVVCGLMAAVLAGTCDPAMAQDPIDAATPITMDDGDALDHGEFVWRPELASQGAVRIAVDLTAQIAYVYRGTTMIGITTVSSGRDGHLTPTGTFPIIEKARMHKSTLYSAAPMPFMERLTMDGVALHAGIVPGRRSSHGCIHLPRAFAEDLYAVTRNGDVVEIGTFAPTERRDVGPLVATAGASIAIGPVTAIDIAPVDLGPAPREASRGWRRLLPTMLASR